MGRQNVVLYFGERSLEKTVTPKVEKELGE
jgi:hypothetical protein